MKVAETETAARSTMKVDRVDARRIPIPELRNTSNRWVIM
jgi:hypothetical protein